MKRVLSTMLAVIMVLSAFSCLTFTVSAAEENDVKYEIKTSGFKNGEITFDIQLAPNQAIKGSLVSVKFNSAVLEVVKAGPAVTIDEDGNENELVPGLHEDGVSVDDSQCYTFVYTTSLQDGYKVGSMPKSIYTITFKAKSTALPTSIEFFSGSSESTDLIKAYSSIMPLDTPVVTGYWLEDGALGFSWNAVAGSDGGYFVYKKVDGEFVKLAEGTPATAFKDADDLVSGTTYTYGIASRDGIYGLPGIMYEFDVTYIAPPKTSFEIVNSGIKVSWTAVSGAEKYLVYRSVLNDGVWSSWETVASVASTTRYWTDKNVTKGVTYKYAASAVVDGVETYYGTDASVEYIPLIVNLATPVVSRANTTQGIKISWDAVENAEKYIVYQRVYNAKTKKYSAWKALKTTTDLTYTDTTVKLGTIYSYTVLAVNGESKSSFTATKGLTYNVAPTVKVANVSNGVKVTWSTVANATGYTVYSSTYNAKTKSWSGWKNRGTTKAGITSWVDKSATKSGTYYKYTVRACYGSVKGSYNKNGAPTLYLAQPTVKIANATTGMKVAWNKIAGSKGYTIYRSEYVDGAWTKWKNMGTAKNTKTSWVDKSAKSGTTYRYTVIVINGKYKSSFKASSALMYLAQPKVTVAKKSNGITVNWTQVEGATSYTVYRSEYNAKTKKWSSWKSFGTAPAPTSQGVDTSAKKGVQYRYTVRAANGKYKSAYKASSTIKR